MLAGGGGVRALSQGKHPSGAGEGGSVSGVSSLGRHDDTMLCMCAYRAILLAILHWVRSRRRDIPAALEMQYGHSLGCQVHCLCYISPTSPDNEG